MSRMERGIIADAPYLPAPGEDVEDLVRGIFKQSPKPEKTRKWRVWLFVALPVLAVIAVYIGNGAFAPLRYDDTRIAKAAGVLTGGGGYHVRTLDIDFSALRAAQIAGSPEASDVMVIGGSPWRSVQRNLGWEASFLNGFQPGLSVPMLEASVAMLIQEDRLPGVMVLSIGPGLFRPVRGEGSDVLSRLSPLAFFNGVSGLMDQRGVTGPSMQPISERNWILLPDGSIVEPARVRGQDAEALSLAAADRLSSSGLLIDTEAVAAFGAVIGQLQKAGVDVRLAIPPYNPTYWDAIEGWPRHVALLRLEEVVAKIAEERLVEVIGGFDPATLGCPASMFRDARHAGPDCLGRVIGAVAPRARN